METRESRFVWRAVRADARSQGFILAVANRPDHPLHGTINAAVSMWRNGSGPFGTAVGITADAAFLAKPSIAATSEKRSSRVIANGRFADPFAGGIRKNPRAGESGAGSYRPGIVGAVASFAWPSAPIELVTADVRTVPENRVFRATDAASIESAGIRAKMRGHDFEGGWESRGAMPKLPSAKDSKSVRAARERKVWDVARAAIVAQETAGANSRQRRHLARMIARNGISPFALTPTKPRAEREPSRPANY